MDSSSSSPSTPELVTPQQQPSSENPTSKRRRMVHKTVARVRVEESSGKQKGDGPPADQWSWRKYGQKPIKGSPYPRGYYRCSTSKGCSAKKQVERCRTNASVLVITYTSSHNHPGPDLPQRTDDSPPSPSSVQHTEQEDLTTSPRSSAATACDRSEGSSHPQSPQPKCLEDSSIQSESRAEEAHNPPTATTVPFDEGGGVPRPSPATRPSSEENDFFDELEELPMSSSFTSLMRSSSSFDIIPIS